MQRTFDLAVRFLLGAGVALALAATANARPAEASVEISYTRTQLDNGLTLIVHADHKAPIAHVAVWYHVGSKDEPKGRSGFAHLYEHLMFEGTKQVPDFDIPLEEVGASNNGTTDFDRTNFYVNLPVTALDRVLWIEADRMRTLLDAMDQEKLDTQRGVVQNEKRQGENEPYGLVWERLFEALYPAGHPYRWLPIGSMEDLNAASLDDVKTWYRDYYGAANAVLVVAGDVDAAEVAATVQRYFGDLPSGPPRKRVKRWFAPRVESTREEMSDRVAQPRVYVAYNVPGFGEADNDTLGVFAYLLGGSKTSRLYERLVFREQLVDSVSASINSGEIGGQLIISADIKGDADAAKVEATIAAELARLRDEGPTSAELRRAKTAFRAAIVRGLERVQGKATVLAECQLYVGDPTCYRQSLSRLETLDIAQLREVARRWLKRGDHTLMVLPQPEYASTQTNGSGAHLPQVTAFPDARIPALERARLSNGIELVLARRHEIPVVNMALQFDAGYAADIDAKPGTASFALSMLDEGAGDYDTLALAAAAEGLGAEIGSGSSLDTSSVSLSALRENLDASMALLADVVQRPRFAAEDIERVRKQWLARIEQEKTEPVSMAMRLLPAQLYGAGHAYANPFSGTGDSAAIVALTREDLLLFQRRWLRPERATLLVVGDTTLDDFLPLAEKHFGRWRAAAETTPSKNIANIVPPTAPRVFLVDKPGAIQSVILAGLVTPSSKANNVLEIDTMNTVLGGLFTARLNANLRETKHWAYGAYSFFTAAAGQRPWMMYSPVQIDKTADAAAELQRELFEYVTTRPASDEEILRARNNDVRSLPGQFESGAAVLGALADIVRFGRPDDYIATLKPRLDAQTDAGIREAARAVLKPQALTWIIVGDLSKIEAPVRALKLGTVQVLDAEGKVLR